MRMSCLGPEKLLNNTDAITIHTENRSKIRTLFGSLRVISLIYYTLVHYSGRVCKEFVGFSLVPLSGTDRPVQYCTFPRELLPIDGGRYLPVFSPGFQDDESGHI